jgi:hypothetical protein
MKMKPTTSVQSTLFYDAKGALNTVFVYGHKEGNKRGPTGTDFGTASTGPGPSYASSVTSRGTVSPSVTPGTGPDAAEEDEGEEER